MATAVSPFGPVDSDVSPALLPLATQQPINVSTTVASSTSTGSDGWTPLSGVFTYVSADAPTFVFSYNDDLTTVVDAGMRIRLTQTTDKFFIVTAVGAFAGGATQITVYGGTDYTLANAAISAGAFSPHKKPFGFNASPAKWTETLSDTSSRSQASPVQGTWYNPGSLSLSVPIGVWDLGFDVPLEVVGTDQSAYATLSTANNSEVDKALTAFIFGTGVTQLDSTLSRSKTVSLAAKTSYYLNAKAGTTGATSLAIRGGEATTIIRAVCAYL